MIRITSVFFVAFLFFLVFFQSLAWAGQPVDTDKKVDTDEKEAELGDNDELPVSWYRLPEDQEGQKWIEGESFLFGKPKPNSVRYLFDSLANALDGYSEKKVSPAGFGKWHFDRLETRFAVSARGVIGLLVGGGSFTADVNWKRKGAKQLQAQPNSSIAAGGIAPVVLSTSYSEQEVRERLEPIMKSLVASGKIENESLFRKNYIEQVLNHHKLFKGFAAIGSPQWRPTDFYIFLRFAAAGNLQPNITLGGGIVSLLTWSIDNSANRIPKRGDGLDGQRESLQKFVGDLGPFLDGIDDSKLKSDGFSLKAIGLSMGVTGDGMVGMAFATGGVSVGVSFSKRAKPLENLQPIESSPAFYLIEKQPHASRVEYAKNHDIYHKWENQETVIYKVPYSKFKKGMEKALKIGSYFTKKSSAVKSKNWYVSEIETHFSLSVSGLTSLVNLGVAATVKLNIVSNSGGGHGL